MYDLIMSADIKTTEGKELKSNKDLEKYITQLDEDVKLSIQNLREKSLMCSSIQAKWLSFLFHEKENLDRILETKQKLLKKKAASKVNDSVLRMKSEDKILENDENMKKLAILQKCTKDNIDFIERALSVLSNFGFQIKNTTDIMKLTSN